MGDKFFIFLFLNAPALVSDRRNRLGARPSGGPDGIYMSRYISHQNTSSSSSRNSEKRISAAKYSRARRQSPCRDHTVGSRQHLATGCEGKTDPAGRTAWQAGMLEVLEEELRDQPVERHVSTRVGRLYLARYSKLQYSSSSRPTVKKKEKGRGRVSTANSRPACEDEMV